MKAWIALALVFLAGPVFARPAQTLRLAGMTDLEHAPLAAVPPISPLLPATEGASGGGPGKVVRDSLLGGAAGGLIGLGLALIEGDNYGRNIAIGAGAGLIVGAVVGIAANLGDRVPFPTGEGLGAERNPLRSAHAIGIGGRF